MELDKWSDLCRRMAAFTPIAFFCSVIGEKMDKNKKVLQLLVGCWYNLSASATQSTCPSPHSWRKKITEFKIRRKCKHLVKAKELLL